MATVSWQSAFWAIIALGINTACQPAGSVLGYSSEFGKALRTSPFVCIADSVLIYAYWLVFCLKGYGVRKGARAVLLHRSRFHEDLHGANQQSRFERTWFRYRSRRDPNRAMQQPRIEQTWFRVLVFVFGALTQTIKLLAFHGVPWTQVWGMAYLTAFLTIELITIVAEPNTEDRQSQLGVGDPESRAPLSTSLVESYSGATFATQVWHWLWIVMAICMAHSSVSQPAQSTDAVSEGTKLYSILWILPLGSPIAILCLLITSGLTFNIRYYVFSPSGYLACGLGLGAMFYGATYGQLFNMGQLRTNTSIPLVDSLAILLMAIPSMLLCSYGHWKNFHLIKRKMHSDQQGDSRQHWNLSYRLAYFSLVNCVSLILYYCLLYDPTGTVKPSWTENLG